MRRISLALCQEEMNIDIQRSPDLFRDNGVVCIMCEIEHAYAYGWPMVAWINCVRWCIACAKVYYLCEYVCVCRRSAMV